MHAMNVVVISGIPLVFAPPYWFLPPLFKLSQILRRKILILVRISIRGKRMENIDFERIFAHFKVIFGGFLQDF